MFGRIFSSIVGRKRTAAGGGSSLPKFEVGQVWKYVTRPGEEDSTLTIDLIERVLDKYDVVHISVIGVRLSSGQNVIPHLPMGLEALQQSVTELVGRVSQLPAWEEGHAAWKDGRGGAFSLTVAEVVDHVVAITQGIQRRLEQDR